MPLKQTLGPPLHRMTTRGRLFKTIRPRPLLTLHASIVLYFFALDANLAVCYSSYA